LVLFDIIVVVVVGCCVMVIFCLYIDIYLLRYSC
jgi:hypothetical protein